MTAMLDTSQTPQLRTHLRPRTLIRDQVFERLSRDIVTGRIQPMEEIRDSDLQAEYGVSRTPIREAIIRLADLGLIQLSSNRYTRVAPIDLNMQLQRAQSAHALIGYAAQQLAPRISTQELAELRRLLDRVRAFDPGRFARHEGLVLWYDFYAGIVEMSGNTVISSILREYLGPHLLRPVHGARLSGEMIAYLAGYVGHLYRAFENKDGARARDLIFEAFAVTVAGSLAEAIDGQLAAPMPRRPDETQRG